MNKSDIKDPVRGLNMVSLFMKGPYNLSTEKVDELITARSPGNYALGHVEGHAFIVRYIGRSDFDLRGRLKDWLEKYTFFKWSYASSVKEAYEKECQNYHDFGENRMLENRYHPAKLDGKDWKCPVCNK